MSAGDLIARFRAARRDPDLVVLEGLHAFKHAVRFGARILDAYTAAPEKLARLTTDLAPDLAEVVAHAVRLCARDTFDALTPHPVESEVVAIARRPEGDAAQSALEKAGRLVVLDQPRHLGNVGAVIRVAAARGAAGVIVLGDADPWHPAAVRAAAGLQFALPCVRLSAPPVWSRPLVAFSAEGRSFEEAELPAHAALAFGSERRGLDPALREAATCTVAIPMRDGVSSLNLATTAAIALYALPSTD